MKPFEVQELEKRGMFDTFFSGKPEENGWKELNNILANAEDMSKVPAGALKKAAGKWDVKFNDRNVTKRSAIYRRLAEVAFVNMGTQDDQLQKDCAFLAQELGLSPQATQLANRGAKQLAYAQRCRGIVSGTEKLTIHELNELFGYDYEAGLVQRKEVFEEEFYKDFEKFEEKQRYSLADEEKLTNLAEKLDVPFELKENLTSALIRFRNLWNAESQDLQPIKVQFQLEEGESCYAGTNSGRCLMKKIEVEDNFFDLNREFKADDTISFKDNALDTNKRLQEHLLVEEIGVFFITNKRMVFLSEKTVVQHALADVIGDDYKDNCIYFHMKDGSDVVYKYSDEAAECMFIIFNRVLQGKIKLE